LDDEDIGMGGGGGSGRTFPLMVIGPLLEEAEPGRLGVDGIGGKVEVGVERDSLLGSFLSSGHSQEIGQQLAVPSSD